MPSSSALSCLGGEIGRHKGLKIPRLNGRAGSTPAQGTITLLILPHNLPAYPANKLRRYHYNLLMQSDFFDDCLIGLIVRIS